MSSGVHDVGRIAAEGVVAFSPACALNKNKKLKQMSANNVFDTVNIRDLRFMVIFVGAIN